LEEAFEFTSKSDEERYWKTDLLLKEMRQGNTVKALGYMRSSLKENEKYATEFRKNMQKIK